MPKASTQLPFNVSASSWLLLLQTLTIISVDNHLAVDPGMPLAILGLYACPHLDHSLFTNISPWNISDYFYLLFSHTEILCNSAEVACCAALMTLLSPPIVNANSIHLDASGVICAEKRYVHRDSPAGRRLFHVSLKQS